MCIHPTRLHPKLEVVRRYKQNDVVKLLIKQLKQYLKNPCGKNFDEFLNEFAKDINDTLPSESVTFPHFEERLARFALFASGQEFLSLPEFPEEKDVERITSNFREQLCNILKSQGVDPETFKDEFDESFGKLNKDILENCERQQDVHLRILEFFITQYEELYQETETKYEKLLREKDGELTEIIGEMKQKDLMISKLKERLTMHEFGIGSLPPKRYMFPTVVIEIAILSVVYAKCSLRGAVKILEIVQEMLVNFNLERMPSHITVSDWITKTGFSIYRDNPKEWMVREGYYIIFDLSVSVGSEKLLIILAVPTMIKKKRALRATDVMIAYMRSAENWDAEKIMLAVQEVITKFGKEPEYCVSDCGNELVAAMSRMCIPHHKDIAHSFANFLETVYEGCEDFNEFSRACGKTRKFYLSTYGYLMAPSARTKARFMNIFIPAFWAYTLLDNYFKFNTFERFMYESILKHASLIEELMEIEQTYNSIFKVIKNKGLSEETHKLCVRILRNTLCLGSPRQMEVASKILAYFEAEMRIVRAESRRRQDAGEEHFEVIHELSSDVIESLFGSMKRIMPSSKFFGLTENCLTLNLYTVIKKPSDIHGLDIYKRLSETTATSTEVDLWKKGGNIGPCLLGKRKGILCPESPILTFVVA